VAVALVVEEGHHLLAQVAAQVVAVLIRKDYS
jgi:hypothetical protein